MKRLVLAGVIAVAAIVLLLVLGDSQLRAQAPVPGEQTSLIRTAGIDLLLRRNVALAEVPRCRTRPERIVCEGTRADGAPIRVEGPTSLDPVIIVTVGGRFLAKASARQVIAEEGSVQ